MSEAILFGAGDYAVFGAMLAISLGIGIFHAVKDRKSKNVQDYMLGGRQMNWMAVGASTSLSFVSSITILGIPTEIYVSGSMYCWFLLATFITTIVVTEIYTPLFLPLQLTSSYEYLERRFNHGIRAIATVSFITQTVFYIGVQIYAPSLAFAQVSGFNLWAAIGITGMVCTIYTALGGLKAVIWTDVFQGVVMIVISIVVLFISASEVGGWNQVWQKNYETGRFDFFVFDVDPRVRHSFWSVTVGLSILWISVYGTSQSQVQRYIACPSISTAKKSGYFSFVFGSTILTLCFATGWVMYAYFAGCDPLLSRQVNALDQLLPLMVLRIFRNFPGLSGAFMASVYAGCLSTVSTGINALGCVTSEDFIKPYVTLSDARSTALAKILVSVYGLIVIGFACLSTLLGNVLQTASTLLAIIGGPTLGIYTLGVLFPPANAWGAGAGFFSGLFLVSWIYGGSRVYPPPIKFLNQKFLTISECSATTESVNFTMSNLIIPTASASTQVESDRPVIADLYAVSYAYYTAIGFAATLLVGLIVSYSTGGFKRMHEIDPLLIIPFFDHPSLKPILPEWFRRKMRCGIDRRSATINKMHLSDISGSDKNINAGKDNLSLGTKAISTNL